MSAIAIGILVVVVIGLVVSLAVILSSKSTEDPPKVEPEETENSKEKSLSDLLAEISGTYKIVQLFVDKETPSDLHERYISFDQEGDDKLKITPLSKNYDTPPPTSIENIEWDSSSPNIIKTEKKSGPGGETHIEFEKTNNKWEIRIKFADQKGKPNITFVRVSDDIKTEILSYYEQTKVSSERNSCSITFPSTKNSDGTGTAGETVVIGEPWYQDQNNPMRCFAPVNQKCCEQVDLPGGEEGCMIDFTGYTPASLRDWVTSCIRDENAELDIDKLGLLSSHFSGEWNVYEKNNSPVSFKFDIQTDSDLLKVKEISNDPNSAFLEGIYKIKYITVNPKKEIESEYKSDTSGRTTTFIIKEAPNGEAIVSKIVTSYVNNEESNDLTTYNLRKGVSQGI